jgi:hypothetical protein
VSLERDVYLNQCAQGVVKRDESLRWFSGLARNEKRSVLERLVYFVAQAGAVGRHVSLAVRESGLKPTFTPCILLAASGEADPEGSRSLRAATSKLLSLPEQEAPKSFQLLLQLLRTATDERAARGLAAPERHWWELDLRDEEEVRRILREE